MPLIFEPPALLLSAQAAGSFGSPPGDGSGLGWTLGAQQVWIGASPSGGKTKKWSGCNVLLSLTGESYATIGQITKRAKQGVLTAALPLYSGAGIDFTNTLAVDLTMSRGTLPNGFGVAAAVFATVTSGNTIAFNEEGALDNVAVGDYVGDLTAPGSIGAGVTVASVSPGGLTPSVTLSVNVSGTVNEGDLILFAPVPTTANPLDSVLGQTLCYVGGEIIAYAYAAPTGTNTYALQGLYRGWYGSTNAAHNILTAPTTAATSSGAVLHFGTGGVPSLVEEGICVVDATNPAAIPVGDSVLSLTTSEITLSVNVAGTVGSGDTINFPPHFCLLDDAIFKYNLPPALSATPATSLLFKFPSFNGYGGGLVDPSTLPAKTHTPSNAGAGWGPAGGPLAAVGQILLVTGNFTMNRSFSGYELDSTAGPFTLKLPASPTAGETYSVGDSIGMLSTNPVTIDANGNGILTFNQATGAPSTVATMTLGISGEFVTLRWNQKGTAWTQS